MSLQPAVHRHIQRADPSAAARLARAGVATAHEAQGRSGLMAPCLRPLYRAPAVAGSAVTVLCQPGDNLMVHLAVECCRPGDVVVVAVSSPSTDSMVGELLATSLRAHGAVAAVVDAGVRDAAGLRAMAFPAWSRAISAQGTCKDSAGSVNVPVVCAGRLVRPGDVIVADEDGVLVVPREDAITVAGAAEQRMAREIVAQERLARGELGADFYGLRAVAERLGIAYPEPAEAEGQTDDNSS